MNASVARPRPVAIPIGRAVLLAVRDGAETAHAAAAVTGLTERQCSAWLSHLHARGQIVRVGRVRFDSGHHVFRYRVSPIVRVE